MSRMPELSSSASVSPATDSRRPLVALLGNPNTGKTTVFNMLTGARRRVGNYPGITVEKVTGCVTCGDFAFELLDLPGTYSLAARSPDEMLVADALLGVQEGIEQPAAAIIVVDASNLERNLFLMTQVLETGVAAVVGLNMVDVAERNGIEIDPQALSARLGVPVIPLQARSGQGREALLHAVCRVIDEGPSEHVFVWPKELRRAVDVLAAEVGRLSAGNPVPPDYLLLRSLLDVGGYAETRLVNRYDGKVADFIAAQRRHLEEAGLNLPSLEAELRYGWIDEVVGACVTRTPRKSRRRSDRLDDLLTHRLLGSIIFVTVMGAMFTSVFSWAAPLMDGIDAAFGWLGTAIHAHLGSGVLGSFLADGLVAGVGGVLTFLPQILILFALITVLEDCGYLARAAFLMDRVMRVFGLGGRSFVPMLSSFACAIPGILATRTIENPRDRLVTILVAPLMTCSARIPIYTLLVAAFVPNRMVVGFLPLQGLVFTGMYFFGIVAAALVALVLKHTILPGSETPFLLELPSYKMPSLRTIVFRLYDRGKAFVLTAGTIILALSIVIWALLYFPRPASVQTTVRAQLTQAGVTDEATLDHAVAGAYLRQSFLGRVGQGIAPLVRPLGWDWKIGMAAVAAFPAREVVISTMGIIYNLGEGEDETSVALQDKLRSATGPDGQPVYSLPVALSIMAFFALCCQCQATIAIMRRETNSWRWPILAFTYMTTLAYVASWAVFRVASAWG